MSGFNFGRAGTPAGGFTFGSAKTTTTSTTAFTFSTPVKGGFNFGTPSQSVASTSSAGLFSIKNPAPTTQTTGLSFGTPIVSTPAPVGSGFSLRSVTTSATQSATTTGSSFIGGSVYQTRSTSFNVVSMGNAVQPTTFSGLSFTPATQASSGMIAAQPVAPFRLCGQFPATTSATTTTTVTTTTTTTITSGFTFNLKPLTSTEINCTVPVNVNFVPSTSMVRLAAKKGRRDNSFLRSSSRGTGTAMSGLLLTE